MEGVREGGSEDPGEQGCLRKKGTGNLKPPLAGVSGDRGEVE